MTREWLLMSATILAVCVSATAQENKDKIKTSYLSTAEAGPDFLVQGEYVGDVGDAKYGAQVIARGDGKFEAFLLKGGLPGAGWDSKTRLKISGETKDEVTTLK